MSVERERLRADVMALVGMVRSSAGQGEAVSARWIAGALDRAGAHDVRVESFRFQGTYAGAHVAHAAAGLLGARLGGRRGALLALAALASLELDASGRGQWLRRLLPAGEGCNVLARVPATGERRLTVVLDAHHDAARTGLFWSRAIVEAGARRRLKRKKMAPALALSAAGYLMVAAGAPLVAGARRGTRGRGIARVTLAAGRALLWTTVAGLLDIASSPTVPGASDNATGVAALLELTRRLVAEPIEGCELIVLAPGAEEAGMGGMGAFLRSHRRELHPARTLVLGLDTLGAGRPIVCVAEGTMLGHRYREADVELVEEGARRAGVGAPERWRLGTWTDPILARFAGLAAVSVLSVGPKGIFTNYHRMSDVPAAVDWDCVAGCVRIAHATIAEGARRSAP